MGARNVRVVAGAVAALAAVAAVGAIGAAAVRDRPARPRAAGVAVSESASASAPPSPSADPSLEPTSPPVPQPSPSFPAGDPVTGDVDGNGIADTVRVVESTADRESPDWRWGVRVDFVGGPYGGTSAFAWRPEGESGNEGQTITGLVDVDGNGAEDIVVSPGTTAYSIFDDVVTLVLGKLRFVTMPGGDLWSAETGAEAAWPARGFDCVVVDEHPALATIDTTTRDGTVVAHRETFRVADGRATSLGTETLRWPEGSPPPPGWTTGSCGLR
jgi:hypothetical protein